MTAEETHSPLVGTKRRSPDVPLPQGPRAHPSAPAQDTEPRLPARLSPSRTMLLPRCLQGPPPLPSHLSSSRARKLTLSSVTPPITMSSAGAELEKCNLYDQTSMAGTWAVLGFTRGRGSLCPSKMEPFSTPLVLGYPSPRKPQTGLLGDHGTLLPSPRAHPITSFVTPLNPPVHGRKPKSTCCQRP